MNEIRDLAGQTATLRHEVNEFLGQQDTEPRQAKDDRGILYERVGRGPIRRLSAKPRGRDRRAARKEQP